MAYRKDDKIMMKMKSTLMKRVWEIGDGFKDSIEDVEAGLKEILYIDKGNINISPKFLNI